jgi:hypothetical protein
MAVAVPWETARQDPAYGRAEWKRARLACLKAARWRCQLRLDGCAGAASEADHVDGLASDPQHRNLRAVCTPCHRKVTAQQGNAARGSSGRKSSDPAPTSRIVFEEDVPPY